MSRLKEKTEPFEITAEIKTSVEERAGIIEVLPIGSDVEIFGHVSGKLAAIQITSGNQPVYRLTWFIAGEKKTDWFDPCEFEVVGDVEKVKIGFK